MMMCGFVERVLNSPQTRCQSQSNRWVLRRRANARGQNVAVRRAAGRLFQMCGPVTAKLLIPSVVVVLGTNSVPVSADQRCRLLAIAEIAWQSLMMKMLYKATKFRLSFWCSFWVNLSRFIGKCLVLLFDPK